MVSIIFNYFYKIFLNIYYNFICFICLKSFIIILSPMITITINMNNNKLLLYSRTISTLHSTSGFHNLLYDVVRICAPLYTTFLSFHEFQWKLKHVLLVTYCICLRERKKDFSLSNIQSVSLYKIVYDMNIYRKIFKI